MDKRPKISITVGEKGLHIVADNFADSIAVLTTLDVARAELVRKIGQDSLTRIVPAKGAIPRA